MFEKYDVSSLGLIVSRSDTAQSLDKASKGAMSRWLQTKSARMRIITFPAKYIGDHICYKGHSIYVISGNYKMEIENLVVEWREGDAFIIPDNIPHRSLNPTNTEAKIVIYDTHV